MRNNPRKKFLPKIIGNHLEISKKLNKFDNLIKDIEFELLIHEGLLKKYQTQLVNTLLSFKKLDFKDDEDEENFTLTLILMYFENVKRRTIEFSKFILKLRFSFSHIEKLYKELVRSNIFYYDENQKKKQLYCNIKKKVIQIFEEDVFKS